jgi:2,3-bisphosphoglycerate-independent phosphoglycerate mutase
MAKRKIIMLVSDGLGDRPSARLEHKTPLQAASTPNLDELSVSSSLGLVYPIAPGVTPGSDTSHLALFGLDPYIYYRGRGPFEALGADMDLGPGDLAFRGNFATVDDNFMVLDRRAGRELPEAPDLVSYLNERLKIQGVRVALRHTTEHRFALVIREAGREAEVTDTDPHVTGERILPCKPKNASPESARMAAVVNSITAEAHTLLESHPLNEKRKKDGRQKANAILLRGGGTLSELPGVPVRYSLSAACISGTAVIRGICKALQIETPRVAGVTGDSKTDIKAKARAVIRALDEKDFVFVHFKATDAAGHDKNPELKVTMVEKLDQLVGEIMNGLKGNEVFAVTADHSTPVDLGEHSADPVPLLISAPDVFADGGRFTESAAAFGHIGRLRGLDLMGVLLNQANRVEKFGE